MLRRLQPLAWAGISALALGLGSAVLFSRATGARQGILLVPTLLYPYLAAATVYFTTCVWIVATLVRETPEPRRRVDAWRWTGRVFWGSFATLVFLGLAGAPGYNAVWSINWYLFGTPQEPPKGFWPLLSMPFNYVAAMGNAAALGTVAFVAIVCNHHASDAKNATRVADVISAAQGLARLMSLASALMVTATLTIYLLFGSADQIAAMKKDAAPAANATGGTTQVMSASATASGPFLVRLPVKCQQMAASGSQLECDVVATAAEAQRKPSSSAAYMALVAGLSLTGLLFMLFFSCSAAVEDAYARLLNQALAEAAVSPLRLRRARKRKCGQLGPQGESRRFSAKAWKEEQGIQDGAATDKVLKALALLAPALTGVLTLIVGA